MAKFESISYTSSTAFWTPRGTIFRPRVARKASTMIRAITIHIVRSGAVMLGWKNTIGAGSGGLAGARSQTTYGAGSSKLALIRSAMPLTGVPGLPGA